MFNTTVAQLEAFHQDHAALSRLTPPPIFIRLHEDTRTSLTNGELEFTLWFVFIPIRWRVRHEALENGIGFADRQLSGPMAYWRHEHRFEATSDGAALIDRVTLAHKPGLTGWLTRLMFDGLPLRFLFFYRHIQTRRAVGR